MGADETAVSAGDRNRLASRARSVVAHVAVDHAVRPTKDVAAAVGVSGSAITSAMRKGTDRLRVAGSDGQALLLRSRWDSKDCSSRLPP